MAIVTQIGSLPYDSVEKAVEYSLRHDIPFLPELPLLGDSMIKYINTPGKLSCLSEFKKHYSPTADRKSDKKKEYQLNNRARVDSKIPKFTSQSGAEVRGCYCHGYSQKRYIA